VIAAAQAFVEQHPGWNWAVIVGTAIASWIAPIAGLVTIACALMHAYISWQKYKHWKKTNGPGR
jgi:hypothetical protein